MPREKCRLLDVPLYFDCMHTHRQDMTPALPREPHRKACIWELANKKRRTERNERLLMLEVDQLEKHPTNSSFKGREKEDSHEHCSVWETNANLADLFFLTLERDSRRWRKDAIGRGAFRPTVLIWRDWRSSPTVSCVKDEMSFDSL